MGAFAGQLHKARLCVMLSWRLVSVDEWLGLKLYGSHVLVRD